MHDSTVTTPPPAEPARRPLVQLLPVVEVMAPTSLDRRLVRRELRAAMESEAFSWTDERGMWAATVAQFAEAGRIPGIAWYGWKLADRMFRLELHELGRRVRRLTAVHS